TNTFYPEYFDKVSLDILQQGHLNRCSWILFFAPSNRFHRPIYHPFHSLQISKSQQIYLNTSFLGYVNKDLKNQCLAKYYHHKSDPIGGQISHMKHKRPVVFCRSIARDPIEFCCQFGFLWWHHHSFLAIWCRLINCRKKAIDRSMGWLCFRLRHLPNKLRCTCRHRGNFLDINLSHHSRHRVFRWFSMFSLPVGNEYLDL